MKIRFIGIALIVSFTFLAACGVLPASNSSAVPRDLQAMEEAAEDIIDFVPRGDWERVATDVTDMAAAWKAYQPVAAQVGASQELQDALTSALTELQTAAASQDPAATMQASNDVSAAVIEMFALHSPKIPVDIGRLDVIERQVILDIARQDYAAAEASLANARSAWESVKASVLDHNGQQVADQFEASLAAQASALAARDTAALTREASNALEIVDSLEDLY